MAQQPAECHAHPGLKDAWVAKNWGLSLAALALLATMALPTHQDEAKAHHELQQHGHAEDVHPGRCYALQHGNDDGDHRRRECRGAGERAAKHGGIRNRDLPGA